MIGWLRGVVMRKQEGGRLLLRVQDLGLWVHVPLPFWDGVREGDTVELHTHLIVREDGWTLYGFSSPEEEATFAALLKVNGIGPRLALGMLSFMTPEALRRAVVEDRPEVLQRLPGVGKKTARRIILALQDQWRRETAEVPLPPHDDVNAEVFEALVALGYSVVEAQTALQHLPPDAPADVEERLRLALQYLGSR